MEHSEHGHIDSKWRSQIEITQQLISLHVKIIFCRFIKHCSHSHQYMLSVYFRYILSACPHSWEWYWETRAVTCRLASTSPRKQASCLDHRTWFWSIIFSTHMSFWFCSIPPSSFTHFGWSSTLGFITVNMMMVYTAGPVHCLRQNRLEGKRFWAVCDKAFQILGKDIAEGICSCH